MSGPLGGLTRGRTLGRPQRAVTASPRGGASSTAPAGAPLLARSLAYFRALPEHSLLDGIIRGRVWIPLLGVLLAGIVAMQVEVLKLNAGIGRALDRGTALQSQNELLRVSVAGLADDQRIESLAAGMGMVMPTPASIKFLASGGTAQTMRALSSIHAPDAPNFVSQLVASGAAPTASVASQGTVAPAASTGVPSTSTSPTAGSSTSATTAPSTVSAGAAVTSPTTTTTAATTTTTTPAAPASTGSPAPPPPSTTPTPAVAGAPATGGTGAGAGGGVALSTAAATSTGG